MSEEQGNSGADNPGASSGANGGGSNAIFQVNNTIHVSPPTLTEINPEIWIIFKQPFVNYSTITDLDKRE